MNKTKISKPSPTAKRMALYARVSTQEQTKGQYPSCESQVEEMEAACRSKGWHVQEIIKDEGVSAGSLRRKGLSHMRWLVESGQIDGVMCTWYDRLVRTRDFYILDTEFNRHNIEFITLHDPTDRHTASGRFLETMLVAAKTYEREQTGEKVRTKMRMRAEKGMGNGGSIPFGFYREALTQQVLPDKKITPIVQQMFQIYIQTQSDCKVRDWLKAHDIAAVGGKKQWVTCSIRYLLTNRRYIAEVEINRDNKGIEGLPESEAYRIIPAEYEPVVSKEVFELAQSIRSNRAQQSPHRGGRGKGHNYSLNQCQRVYLMQGNIVCGICGAALSPHYVYHKPNEKEKRRTASYIFHYTCAQKMKYRGAITHSNRVLARVAENRVLDAIENLATDQSLVNRALEISWAKSVADLRPTQDAFAECQRALNENQRQIDELLETATNARGALLELFNEKAYALKLQRETLKTEGRTLNQRLAPLNQNFDTNTFLHVLKDFHLMREKADPLKLQRLLRLIVSKVEWMPDKGYRIQYYIFNSRNGSKTNWPGDGVFAGSRPELQGQPLRKLECRSQKAEVTA
jgi:site-specific DNA recombinase